ncbi:MAG: O-methyltransferase [Anaerovoracaceae bacterium]|jgi:predicted O-methyltransferase YrrM
MNITDEKVTKYINGLYRPLNPFLAKLRQEAEEQLIPIILRDTETLLLTLLQITNPKRILEIGTAIGYSALCFATVKPDAQITTLELQERMQKAAELNFKKAKVDEQIQLLLGDALKTLRILSKQKESGLLKPYDFIFIDGAKGHYLEIWNACMKLCKAGTVIVSDNILFKGMTAADEYLDIRRNKTIVNRMREFLNYITTNKDITTTILPVGDGVAISIIGDTNEEN